MLERLEERRLLSAGDLDTTFAGSGKVHTDFGGGQDDGNAMVALSDGGAVVAGQAGAEFGLARYAADGTVVWAKHTAIGAAAGANAMVLSGGKIVLAGFSVGVGTNNDFTVARYNSDGALDTTFGPTQSGFVTTDINAGAQDEAYGVAVDGSGRILVAGGTGASATRDFAIARYSSDGILDSTFGVGGIVITNFGGSDQANGVIVDGTMIVAAGRSSDDFALARYTDTGVLDSSFGGTGRVTTDFSSGSDEGRAIAKFGGKYYVVGVSHGDFSAAAYSSSGALEAGFGSGGKVTVDFFGNADKANAIAIASNGRIVVGGVALDGATQQDFAVVRLLPSGALDATFGVGGKQTIDFSGTSNDVGNAVALSSGGKILLGGFSAGSPDDFAVVRLAGNSAPMLSSTTVHLSTIDEDETDNAGDSVASMIAQLNASGNLVDSDGDGFGLAITQVDESNGLWQFSLNGGASWESLSGVSETSARLVAAIAAGDTRLRFFPHVNSNSGPTHHAQGELVYKVWDTVGGVNGALADTTAADGTNTFSSGTASADIVVEAVNDAPTFVSGPDQTAVVGSGAHTWQGWATNLSAGGSDESDQTLSFEVSVSDPDHVLAGPVTVDASSGTLSYAVEGSAGSADVTIYLRDSGGTNHGGVDVSTPHHLTISAIDRPAQVWVNDNWTPTVDVGAAQLSFGDTVVDHNGLGHTYGIDAYSTIQEGVNFVNNGGVVIVLDGLYTERVAISRGVSISGQSEGGVIVQADSGGPVDGHDAFDINAPGAAVTIDHVMIRNSDWGVRSVAGNVSVTHTSFSVNGFDGAAYPTPLSAADAAGHFAAHGTDGGAIWIVDSTGNEISFNAISSGDRGIVLAHVSGAHVHDNTVSSNARGGIALFDGSNNFVDTNEISNNGGEGLLLSGESGTSATGNHSNNNANAGVVIFNPREISVSASMVNTNNSRSFSGDGSTNQWPAAIWADGAGAAGGAFTLHLDTNSLTNNGSGGNAEGSVGVYLGAALGGEGTVVAGHAIAGHTIDLRSSVSNVTISNSTITRATIGMLIDGGANVVMDTVNFDGASDAAANNTDLKITSAAGSISSIKNSKFRAKNSGGKYVVSQRAQEIDATTDRFFVSTTAPGSSQLGSSMSLNVLNATEDRIDHGLDGGFAGLIRVKAQNVYVTNASGSIQRGIDVASGGDTVNVKAGTFSEALTIDKSVTIAGVGDATVLAAPASIPNRFTTSAENHPIVLVTGGASAGLRSMKIDGLGHGNGNVRFEGIAFFNAGGTVDHVTITGISDSPMSSEQSGTAIYANNTDGAARDVVVTNTTLGGYQKNGMALSGAGLTATVTGNTVSGAGPLGLLAQNGIQVGFGARGIISNNIVSGNDYTGTSAAAAGILLTGAAAGSSATGNTVFGNDVGIYVISTAGNTLIGGNDASGSDFDGIFVEGGNATISENRLHDNLGAGGGGAGGVLIITSNDIHHNVASGLELYDDISGSSISNNFINNNHDGIFVDASVPGAASLVIRHNSNRDDSDADLDNESAARIDARENWWGSANGPSNAANHYNQGAQGGAIVGNADFAPWLASGEDAEPAVAGFQPSSALFAPITNDAGGSFSTIQSAIDGTAAGGTITLADGVYHESNIRVDKPLTIGGQSVGGVVLGPSMVDGQVDDSFTSASNAFVIQSSQVTIRMMTIDGDEDGGLAGDHNFRSAVVSDYRTGASFSSITIEDLHAQNLYRDGVAIKDAVKSVLNVIRRTTIDNVSIGHAIDLENADADVVENIINHAHSGLRAQGGTPLAGSLLHVDGNTFWPLGGTTTFAMELHGLGDGSTINGNNIQMRGAGRNIGLLISEASGQADITVSGNTLDMDWDDDGIELFEGGDIDHPVVLDHNTVGGTDSADGIVLGAGVYAEILDNNLTGFARGVVVTAIDSYGRIDGNTIDGPGYGVFISGGRAAITGNTIDCNDTGFNGIQAQDGGLGEIRSNTIAHCADGVHIDAGGTASVDSNEFLENSIDLSLTDASSRVTSVTNNNFNATAGIAESLYIYNGSTQNIDATSNRYNGTDFQGRTLQQKFAIEDKVLDALDQSGLGYVKLQSGFIYATAASGSVQRGIDVASGGEILEVQNGTYPENLIVDVPLTIRGESQAGVMLLPGIIGPDQPAGASLGAGASSVVLVQASNVHIAQLTVDGDNPFLTSGVVVNGADIEARNGIITNHLLNVEYDGLEVDHVTVRNIYLRGIYASSGGTFNIHDNSIDNVAGEGASIGIFNFFGSGVMARNHVSRANDAISANWSSGTQFIDNVVSQSGSGVHSDNSGGAGGGGDVLRGNIVSDGTPGSYGVWAFAPYSDVLIEQNQVSGVDVGYAAAGSGGIVGSDVLIIFDQNSYDGLHGPGTMGIYVTTDLFGFGDEAVHAVIRNDNDIINAETGIFAEKKAQHEMQMSAIGNLRSIHGNHVGIDITGGTATISNNRLYDNDIAISVSGGGSVEVDGNVFAIPEAGGFQGPANRIDLAIAPDAGEISSLHGNSFAGADWYIQNHSSQDIDAAGNLFAAANNFRVEDKILHQMDDDALGLVSWVAHNLYVTDAGTDHSIQHAIDIATAGDTINVEAGIYSENLTVDKSLTLRGANAGIAGYAARGTESRIAPGGGTVLSVSVDANEVAIEGLELIGDVGVEVGIAAGATVPKILDMSSSRIIASGDGMVIGDFDGDVIIDGNLISAGSNGIDISGQTSRFAKTRSNIQNNRLISTGSGIVISDIDADLTISNNDVESTGPSADAMVVSGVGKNTPVTRSNISNNRVRAPGRGVVVSDAGMDVSFAGNIFHSGDTGIHIERIDGALSLDGETVEAGTYGVFADTVSGKVGYKNSHISFGGGGGGGAVGLQISNVDDDIDIINNDVLSVAGNNIGIYVANVSTQAGRATKTRSNIQNNRVQTPTMGVWLENLDADADVSGNTLSNNGGGVVGSTNYMGIHSIGDVGDTLSINGNTIEADVNGRGMVLWDTAADLAADGNTITAGISGIEITGADGENTVGGADGNDIVVDGGFGTGVSVAAMNHGTVKFFNNRISSDFQGISLEGVEGDVEISGNTFDCASTGVNLQQSNGTIRFTGNDFEGRSPAPGEPGNGFGIVGAVLNGNVVIGDPADGNSFSNLTAGILISDAALVSISNNNFDHISAVAVDITDAESAALSGNTASAVGDGFVVSSIAGPMQVSVSENLVLDASRGFVVNSIGGPLQVTFGSGNEVDGAFDGLVLSGEQLSVAGNTLGDIAMTLIDSMFVRLDDRALLGLRIDATQAKLDAKISSERSIGENFAIEDKITHATDDASVGFIRVYAGKVFVTQDSGSIQRGVNVAEAGDTLHVSAGTFSEAVVIDKWMGVKGSTGPVHTVVSNPLGAAITITAGGPSSSERTRINDLETKLSAIGLLMPSAISHVTIGNVVATENTGAGIEISGKVRDLIIGANTFSNNTYGLRVTASGEVDGMVMDGGVISNNTFGIYTEADPNRSDNQAGFTNGSIIHVSFDQNTSKGAYWEKVDNTGISDCTFTNNGTSGAFSSGLDINLKYGVYHNIDLSGLVMSGNGTGASDGTGLAIKGRNDDVYASNPASVSGVSLDHVSITGSPIDLSVGNNVTSISFDEMELGGSGVGAVFYSGPRQSTDLAGSRFAGSLVAYVINAQPGIIDVRSSIFGGVDAGSASPQQQFAIVDKILDGVDVPGFGLVRTSTGNVYVTPNSFYPPFGTTSPSIQRGVDSGVDGDTVNVNAGTYGGGVSVSKRAVLGFGIVIVNGDDFAGGGGGGGFHIIGPDVTIDHFRLVGAGTSDARDQYGILISGGGSNFFIQNNHTSGFDTAILVAQAPAGTHHLVIGGNQFDLGATGAGISAENVQDAIIEENELGFGRDAIVIWGGGAVTITRNEITSTTGEGNAMVIRGTVGGVAAGGPIAITENIISGKNIGIYIGDVSGQMEIHTNSITATTAAALQNATQNESRKFDAIGNWWGSSNGPTSADNTWGGTPKGERILGGNVIFAPWLTDGIDADLAVRGFQHAAPDSIAPAVSAPDLDAGSDSGASDHDEITRDNTPTFSGTAEPGATVDVMEGSIVLGTTMADAAGQWSITSSSLSDGVHNIFARATDGSGNTSTSAALAVSIDTGAPVANAGADQTVNEADLVTLSGSFTDGAGFGPYEFVWTQTDGPFVFSTQTGNLLKFSPPDDGVYTFTVTVTDVAGNVGSDSVVVSAQNVNPVVTAVNLDRVTIDENGDVVVTGSFSDVSAADTHTVSIDWGDGSSGLAVVDQASRTFSSTHKYLDDNPSGTSSDQYTISVTAGDDDHGTSAAVTRSITVNNVAPLITINGAPSSSAEGALISLTSTLIDPGTLDTFTYAWTVTKNGAVYASGSNSALGFTPDDNGSYVVTLVVHDDDLGVASDSKTITVSDVAPTISLSGNAHTNEGAVYTLTLGAISDPGADTVVRWYVNWGDSSPLEVFTSGGAKAHTFNEGPSTQSIVVSVEDEDGIHANAGSLSVTVDNVAPTATFGNFGAVNEGSTGFVIFTGPVDASPGDTGAGFRYSFDFNNDGVFEIGNGTYAFGSTSGSATVAGSFLADGPGTRTIRGRISDRDGGFTDYLTTITINNVAPIVNAGPDTSVGVNSFLTQSGSFIDPGADAPWQVWVNYAYDAVSNPGLGSLSQSGASKNFVLSHFYSTPGSYTLRVTVIDKDGASNFDDVIVTVANTRFQVTSFTPTSSGFDVRFNRSTNPSQLNLYDGLDASIDPADVTFFGSGGGTVRGSMVWDFQANVLHFVKSGGVLAADNYTVTLQSRADGFVDTFGELLDGNFDDVAGGDYSTSFTVAASSDRVVGIPDFARGPGQPVNIPATGSGIPIRIDNSSGVNAVDLDVIYDGFQLNVTGAALAPGMPSDWSITTNLVTNGIFKLTISGVTTLAAGARDLIILNATVPAGTPYGGSEMIRIQNLSVNGGFISSRADSAVHKTTYLGDASGNGSLDGFDSSLISRVVVSLDSGFDHASMTDPVIVADVNSNGVVDGLDASWVAQKSLFAPLRPEIPNIGAGPVGSFAGFDPTFAMPQHVHGSAGGAVTVPLSVTDSADGLIGFNINVDYTTALLDVAGGLNSSDVTMGSLFASAGGWSMVSFVDDATGHVGLAFFRATPMSGGTGPIADVQLHMPASDPTISTTLDVNGAAGSETGLVYTYVDGSIDIVTAHPVITGSDGDDTYYLRHSSGYDSLEVYAGTSASGTLIYSSPLSDISDLRFDTGAGNDRLIVDLANGLPMPAGGISYAAGADNDSLSILGNGSGTGSYQPAAVSGSGNFAVAGSAIAFSGVEPVSASGFATLMIVTPGATDVLSIDSPSAGENRVSGTSGGVAISPLTFSSVAYPIINTATNDAGGGDDAITIANGMAANVTALGVNAGSGANTLAINGGTVPLLAIGGAGLAVSAGNSAVVSLTTSQTMQSLSVNDSARVNFASGHKVVHVGNLLIDAAAAVDVSDGRLEIENAATFSSIRSYIRSARNNGSGGLWMGTGLTSSYVAAKGADLAVASVVSGGTIVVRPALIGDLNLDDSVSISDFIDLAANFNGSGVWATGDLNYDDATTISDFIDLASHFNQTYPPPPSAPAFAAASEEIVASPSASVAWSDENETSSSPIKGHKKKTHSRRVRHHRPGGTRPGISRHQ